MGASAAPTTLFAFKRAVIDALAALPALAGVQCSYGDPLAAAELECIFFGSDVDADSELAGMRAGKKIRNETYTVPLNVAVMAEGEGEFEAAEARLAELWDAVTDFLTTNPAAGTTVVQSVEVERWRFAQSVFDRGVAAGVELSLTVRARIV